MPGSLVNAPTLLDHLSISRPTLERLIDEGMPCLVLGPRSRRFDLDAVESWLADRRAA